jgi:hypothetical protein
MNKSEFHYKLTIKTQQNKIKKEKREIIFSL